MTDVITSLRVPSSLIQSEIDGLYGSSVLQDMHQIIKLYEIYDKGAAFIPEGSQADYVPADLRFKTARTLIDKEARFMFSIQPNFKVVVDLGENKKDIEDGKKENSILQSLVNTVMKKNKMAKKLVQAAKDCFIGKRVACILNFNDTGISVQFIPSLEFVYDVEGEDSEKLSKFVAFYCVKDHAQKSYQEIHKKKYWMENGYCYVEEAIYDGLGHLKKEIIKAKQTLFSYIPAVIIINDGLTGDLLGASEIEQLMAYESWYSRLGNADIDAERKGMNPIKYMIDINPNTSKGLSSAAGSVWDLQSDQNLANETSGSVGTLESGMTYSSALDTTLKRIKGSMYQLVDVPDIEALQANFSSGKELKAIYWGLVVRTDEKMAVWGDALEFVVTTIIEGARLYPKAAKVYTKDKVPEIGFSVSVENTYPLPEDEIEEKTMDISEVMAQTMSKKSYMKKWRALTDDESEEELQQIARERELLEESFSFAKDASASDDFKEEDLEGENEKTMST